MQREPDMPIPISQDPPLLEGAAGLVKSNIGFGVLLLAVEVDPAGISFEEYFRNAAGRLTRIDEVDWSGIDLAFCALPHATCQEVVAGVPEAVKV
jgi:hypothetical protein